MSATILLVEDNPHIMKINNEALTLRGYRVLEAATLSEGRALFEQERPNLILLDIMLPDGSGIAFCEELREHSDVPILFLTALNESDSVVQGLRAGGDDYLAKPYDLGVLLARIEALLRRANRLHPSVSGRIGNLALDYTARRASCDGADLLLTAKEFSILELLCKSHGSPVATDALHKSVWGSAAKEGADAVKVHVSRLRGKLEAAGATVIIRSERGKGYALAEAARRENAADLHKKSEY